MVKKVYSDDFQDHYNISDCLGLVLYKESNELVMINFDDGEEFMIAEDFEEAEKVARLILEVIGK